MTDRPLFRPEAVEHHARGLVTNRRRLDLDSRTTTLSFRLLLLCIAAAVVASFVVRADESARGTALTSGREATVMLPVGALARLRPGQLVTIEVGGREVHGRVAAVGDPVAGPPPAVPVRAVLDADAGRGSHPDAVVRLNRQTVAEMLLPRLRSLFGRGGPDA